jgi:hypothetical protein
LSLNKKKRPGKRFLPGPNLFVPILHGDNLSSFVEISLVLFLFLQLSGNPGAQGYRTKIAVDLFGIPTSPMASTLLGNGLVGFEIVGTFVVVADKQLAPHCLRRWTPGFQSRAAMRAVPLFTLFGHFELLLGKSSKLEQ